MLNPFFNQIKEKKQAIRKKIKNVSYFDVDSISLPLPVKYINQSRRLLMPITLKPIDHNTIEINAVPIDYPYTTKKKYSNKKMYVPTFVKLLKSKSIHVILMLD
jgi:hypothetical protein